MYGITLLNFILSLFWPCSGDSDDRLRKHVLPPQNLIFWTYPRPMRISVSKAIWLCLMDRLDAKHVFFIFIFIFHNVAWIYLLRKENSLQVLQLLNGLGLPGCGQFSFFLKSIYFAFKHFNEYFLVCKNNNGLCFKTQRCPGYLSNNMNNIIFILRLMCSNNHLQSNFPEWREL